MIADGVATSLSAAFRQRTLALHSAAERSGIVADMLRGRVTRDGYAMLLRNLLPAYAAMETELERKRHLPAFAGMADPAVYRVKALETALSALGGQAWADALPLLPAGRYYADRITECAKGDGARLIAHIYTRYLGDLNGGQILKRLMAKSLALDSDALSFFDFPDIADMDRFRGDYRAAIDRAADEIQDIDRVVEEAATAFTFNIRLSDAVQQAVTLMQTDRASIGIDRAPRPAAGGV